MTTPKRAEILAKAVELFHNNRARYGDPSFAITPTEQELKEGGYLSSAQSELMTSMKTKNAEFMNTTSETSAFMVDIEQLFDSGSLILGSKHTGKSDAAMLIADKAKQKNAVVIVFDPSQDWTARSSISNVMKVQPFSDLPIPNENTILDVSMLSPNEQQEIVENFSKKLFERQAENPIRKQYVIIFEEAHTYFYQGCMREQKMRNTVRLLSVGRNVSIATVLISQFCSMLDKFCIKHSTSQAWFGFTREPNDLKYLKQILGSDAEKLAKLSDGEFLYLTRKTLSKINIEPYESDVFKTQIANTPQREPANLIKTNQNASAISILKLAMLLCFAVLFLRVIA